MQETTSLLTNSCNFSGIRPAMADLPYPKPVDGDANKIYLVNLHDDTRQARKMISTYYPCYIDINVI